MSTARLEIDTHDIASLPAAAPSKLLMGPPGSLLILFGQVIVEWVVECPEPILSLPREQPALADLCQSALRSSKSNTFGKVLV